MVKAIILAGGMGTRLGKYTKNLPKCMLEFAEKSLVERQVETFRACGINDIIIVRKHLAEKIQVPGVRYIDETDYDTHMVVGLFKARDEFDDDIILSYGDVLFESRILRKLMETDADVGIVGDEDWKDYWTARIGSWKEDSESFIIGENDKMISLGVSNPPEKDMDARYVGMIKFSRGALPIIEKIYDNAVKESWETPWHTSKSFKKAYMTDFMQELIDKGLDVRAVRVKRGWMEFDTVEDYELGCKWMEEGTLERFYNIEKFSYADLEIDKLIDEEKERLEESLELIPSENYVSKAVLTAMGSILTNKYSEGYPGKRYYGGNKIIDKIETLAIKRAKKLFNAEHVNVQPYSGSPANLEVYSAFVKPGDKIMSMSLTEGGHLTHGHFASFTGQVYNFVHYGVDVETGLLDYKKIRALALKEKPKIIVCGATAYPRKIDFEKFAEISKEVGAICMADISHVAGLIVSGNHPSPFRFVDVVNTKNNKTLRGPRGAMIMCKERYAKQIDKAVFPGLQGGPHNNTTAAIAVALGEASSDSFKEYGNQVVKNAKVLAEELKRLGLSLVSGGTDNHLILIDLSNMKCAGKEAENALDSANITLNKNTIPGETRSPFNPSGIRLGTPFITTRGMKENEMKEIAGMFADVLENYDSEDVLKRVKEKVIE